MRICRAAAKDRPSGRANLVLVDDIAFCRTQIDRAEARAARAPSPEAAVHDRELARLYRQQLGRLNDTANAVFMLANLEAR